MTRRRDSGRCTDQNTRDQAELREANDVGRIGGVLGR